MYPLLYTVNAALMLLPPLLLGWWLSRRLGIRWRLFGIGVATFLLAQLLHVPVNWLLIQQLQIVPTDNLPLLALFLGLSAGLFEEVARYLTYRHWIPEARRWGQGLMLGAGHGGVEAILIGLAFTVNFVALSLMRADLIPLPAGLAPEQMAELQTQIDTLYTMPYPQTILGGLERLFALTAHLALSLMVLQVFVRRRLVWLLVAIGWHTLLNATAVYLIQTTSIYVTEGAIGLIALLSLGFIWWLRGSEPIEPPAEPLPPTSGARPLETTWTPEKLDESRYD